MGDAWTAVNTDEYTLFYNPASMGRHSRDLTFSPFNPTITGTNVLSDMDRFEDFPDTPAGVADVIMDYPVHIGTNFAPGFKLFNFGINLIASEQVDLLLRNRIHPTLDIDYRSDRGFVMGVGVPIGPGRVNGKSASGQQTTIGLGAKYIKRRGIYDGYSLTGTDLLDLIDSSDDVSEIVRRLGLVEGSAWGFDAGLEHVIRRGLNQVVFGLAALDIGTTDFKVPSNENNKTVAPNRDQVNLAAAYMHRSALLKGTFSLEMRGLTQEMETMERFRLGMELGTMGISGLAGWNAGYLSYGLAVDVGIFKATAGFYGVEAGGGYRRTESERFVIYLSLFDFSFDA